jgi:hypothetical protein
LTLLGGRQNEQSGGPGNTGGSYSRGASSGYGQLRYVANEHYAYADRGIGDDDIPF